MIPVPTTRIAEFRGGPHDGDRLTIDCRHGRPAVYSFARLRSPSLIWPPRGMPSPVDRVDYRLVEDRPDGLLVYELRP